MEAFETAFVQCNVALDTLLLHFHATLSTSLLTIGDSANEVILTIISDSHRDFLFPHGESVDWSTDVASVSILHDISHGYIPAKL